MRKNAYGFTLVELLVVIAVIGILASISTIAFNGIQVRAHNTTRHQEIKSWQKLFELYKATYGSYPSMTDGGYCLGTGFPIGYDGVPRCRDYSSSTSTSYVESNNAALMTEIKKVGSLPGGPRIHVNYTVGPYANYTTYGIVLRIAVNGTDASACPPGTTYDWSDGSKLAICHILLSE